MSTDEDRSDSTRAQCTPCRGTGRVISNLSGQAHDVVCPWCGGSGAFTPGRDAQQSPAEKDER
jgi:DnaJ-class molecular chaperone